MIALIQRVTSAQVEVNGETVGKINQGLLVLLGVAKEDDQAKADRLLERISNYRIFSDDNGRMNLSLKQVEGDMLVVSQFTLVADTKKGTRPGFSRGAPPELGEALYNHFVAKAKEQGISAQTGQFGADMQVSLVNDGPVTFNLEV